MVRQESGAESGALDSKNGAPDAPADADLARLIDRWPTLSEVTKAAILAMIDKGAGQ